MRRVDFALAGVLLLALGACMERSEPLAPGGRDGTSGVSGNPSYSAAQPFETPLIAGRDIEIGAVRVWNDEETLFVQFEVSAPDWCLYETHVHAAQSVEGIPQTPTGNPIPGHFVHKMGHACVTEFTEQLELEWEPGTELAIAAHAAVSGGEGAWASGEDFPGRNPAMYFLFPVQGADDGGDDGDGGGDDGVGGFAVRYRSFGNTEEAEVFLGSYDLEADERLELDLGSTAWSESNPVAFEYDPTMDLLTTRVEIGSETFTLEYPNASAQAEALTGCALADMSRLVFTVSAGDAETSVVLQDVFLGGDELGSLSGADGPNVFELTDLDFSGGFSLTGNLTLGGSFGADPDLSFVEIATLCRDSE